MLGIITLTKGGEVLANKIAMTYKQPVEIHTKVQMKALQKSLKEYVNELYKSYDQLLFIMASGIVVRMVAPLLEHKSKDPAILVMDEKGKYVISLLSGHLGGANALATALADCLENCQPVITTASDVNGLESVDMLAKRLNYQLIDFDGAKNVTAVLVNGEAVGIISSKKIKLSAGYQMYPSFSEAIKAYLKGNIKGIVWITNRNIKPYSHTTLYSHLTQVMQKDYRVKKDICKEEIEEISTHTPPIVTIIPKNLVLGIGCKKDYSSEKMLHKIKEFMTNEGYAIESIGIIASAWVKADEKAIRDCCTTLKAEFQTFQKEAIANIEAKFKGSAFVKQTLGIAAVSEPCGYLASNQGKCLVKKVKDEGMTLSLWEK